MPIKQVPPIAPETQQPKTGGIAWWIELTLVRFAQRAFNSIAIPMQNLLSYALEQFLDAIEAPFINAVRPMLDEIKQNPACPGYLIAIINQAEGGKQAAFLVLIPLLLIPFVTAIIGGLMQPLSYMATQDSNSVLRPGIPNVQEAFRAFARGQLSAADYASVIAKSGFPDQYKGSIAEIFRERPDISLLANSMYRGYLTPVQVTDELIKRSFTPDDANNIVRLMEQIPPLQDIIRMAVRDAWDENIVRNYGYDENYPPEVGEWAKRIGIPAEWAKRYWRAHWQLPSFEQGAEMVHRNIISRDDLETLLRINDYPPYWRQKLIDMTYNVITRVDARRMFSIQAINASELKTIYMKEGYSSDDADKLVAWTIIEYGEENRQLTKAEILKSYRNGLMTAQNATTLLKTIRYSDEDAALILANEDIVIQKDRENEIVENVRLLYVARQIDEIGAAQRLSVLTPPSGFIEDKLKLWRLQQERAVKRPTVKELTQFLVDGAIELDKFREEMHNLMYADDYIDMYVTDIAIQLGVSPDEIRRSNLGG